LFYKIVVYLINEGALLTIWIEAFLFYLVLHNRFLNISRQKRSGVLPPTKHKVAVFGSVLLEATIGA